MYKTYLEPDEIDKLESKAKYFRTKFPFMLVSRQGCRFSQAMVLSMDLFGFPNRKMWR